MKKEEFIKYLEGMQQAFEFAGVDNMVDLLEDIIGEAGVIEVTINNYPYYTQPRTYSPYPWITWYNTTANELGETITTAADTINETARTACSALLSDEKLPQWEVKVTGPNEIDWEINRCD